MSKYAGMSFTQVVNTFSDEITKICIIKLRSVEDAKDCFQNVFLKLYLSDIVFNDVKHLKAWLIRVACNECIDFNRSYWIRNITFEKSIDIYSQFTDDYECIEMIELIRTLPEKDREIIYMYYYHEYTTAEIAEILNLNINTVKSRLRRSRDKLSKVVTNKTEDFK